MAWRRLARSTLTAAVAACLGAAAAAGQELALIPAPDGSTLMRTKIYRPHGPGPFRLAVIAHASTQNPVRRARLPLPRYEAAAAWLVARGYLVALPQRPGHGETGGPYLEDQGGCAGADYARAGLATAASLEAAIRYLTARPDVRRDGIVVLGHSAGGWGAVALASRSPPGVAAVIGFAPGRGGRSFDRVNHNCAPDRLVAAAGSFGRTARIPALWIYAENDGYFAPALAQRMAAAYRGAGGRLAFHLLPRFGEDGHALLAARDGHAVWGPIVEPFLANPK